MSRLGSSDLPRPSSTIMANTIEAKLLSSFTCKVQPVGKSEPARGKKKKNYTQNKRFDLMNTLFSFVTSLTLSEQQQ